MLMLQCFQLKHVIKHMDLDNNTPALRSYSVSNRTNNKRVVRAHDGTNQNKTNMGFLLENFDLNCEAV
jgi:hypothetical protein